MKAVVWYNLSVLKFIIKNYPYNSQDIGKFHLQTDCRSPKIGSVMLYSMTSRLLMYDGRELLFTSLYIPEFVDIQTL